MPSTFRIPAARVRGVHGALARVAARVMFNGQMPDTVLVQLHHPQILRAASVLGMKLNTWRAVDPHLKSYAMIAAAGSIGCSWCVDYGYFMAHNSGLDLAKVQQVPRWRESDVFTPLEREVLAYSEAMTATPPEVTDEMVSSLVDQLGPKAVVELTQVIAFENMVSRFNSAAGLASQGFAESCQLAPAA